jgi:hypothetical protein
MGDTSPKNIHKLEEQKHEEHVQKEDAKHENAERQHVPQHTSPTLDAAPADDAEEKPA